MTNKKDEKKIVEIAYLKAYADIVEKDPVKNIYLKTFIDMVKNKKEEEKKQ